MKLSRLFDNQTETEQRINFYLEKIISSQKKKVQSHDGYIEAKRFHLQLPYLVDDTC